MSRPKNEIKCKYMWASLDFDLWAKSEARRTNSSTSLVTHKLLHNIIKPQMISIDNIPKQKKILFRLFKIK